MVANDPVHLSEGGPCIGQVLDRLAGNDHVKGSSGEGKALGVGLNEVDAIAGSDPGA
jgi:hypothetical protein